MKNAIDDPEKRLADLGFSLPSPVTPLGAYVEALQTGNLLFLSGVLPMHEGKPKYKGRLGAELGVEDGYAAAQLTALNALAIAKEHLGSLIRVTRVVRHSVMIATQGDFFDQPRVADGASELLRDAFGGQLSVRLVYGVASLPVGVPIELEAIFEVD
jgi:enamine deaminase RidA (YjgF/YER057c/UK114 family)